MPKYVDGFVLTVPKKSLNEYKKIASRAGKVWKKYGALDYKECMIDDARPKGVKNPFPKMAKAKSNEVVFFSYIVFKSKTHRNQVNAKVMKDPFMQQQNPNDVMPFNMNTMAYGGFKVLVDQ